MRRLARRLLLLAGIGFSLSGCLSPTLPMPPPAKPDIEQVDAGLYKITGRIPVPGYVHILNKRTEKTYGELSRDDRYEILVVADANDPMQLWYEVDKDDSEILEFEIPAAP